MDWLQGADLRLCERQTNLAYGKRVDELRSEGETPLTRMKMAVPNRCHIPSHGNGNVNDNDV